MSRKTVLIADDEPNVRLTLSRMLSKDYNVLEATNGEEAINIAKEQKPDLILMDLMMPTMDGYTACLRIKNGPSTTSIPVVMLTAIGHELNKKFASEMGADGYTTKPFTQQELLHTVGSFMKNDT